MEPITSKINNFNNNVDDETQEIVLKNIWNSFLNDNPSILDTLNELGKIPDYRTAGAELIANGMYKEAKLWKDYRRQKINSI